MARAEAASRSLLEASLIGLVMLVSTFGLRVFGLVLPLALLALLLALLLVRPASARLEARKGLPAVAFGTCVTAFVTD